MRQQVLYIHGGEAFSDYSVFLRYLKEQPIEPFKPKAKRWPATLREALGENYEVASPEMPNKENAKYDEWKIWFERYMETMQDGLVLVGWSQGAMFLTKYLIEETLPCAVKHLFLVGAIAGGQGAVNETGEDGGDFDYLMDDLPIVNEKIDKITLFHSEDDFVVPYEHALKLKAVLPEVELVTFTDRNHFLQPEFPELIAKIKEIGEK